MSNICNYNMQVYGDLYSLNLFKSIYECKYKLKGVFRKVFNPKVEKFGFQGNWCDRTYSLKLEKLDDYNGKLKVTSNCKWSVHTSLLETTEKKFENNTLYMGLIDAAKLSGVSKFEIISREPGFELSEHIIMDIDNEKIIYDESANYFEISSSLEECDETENEFLERIEKTTQGLALNLYSRDELLKARESQNWIFISENYNIEGNLKTFDLDRNVQNLNEEEIQRNRR